MARDLTQQQKAVYDAVKQGMRNKDIEQALGIKSSQVSSIKRALANKGLDVPIQGRRTKNLSAQTGAKAAKTTLTPDNVIRELRERLDGIDQRTKELDEQIARLQAEKTELAALKEWIGTAPRADKLAVP